jgi:hypothetical protein
VTGTLVFFFITLTRELHVTGTPVTLHEGDAVVVTEGQFAGREGNVTKLTPVCCLVQFIGDMESKPIKIVYCRPKELQQRHTRACHIFPCVCIYVAQAGPCA